jgi:peptide chain release factor 1
MFGRLASVEGRYVELEERMGDPAVAGDHAAFTKLNRELASMRPVVEGYRRWVALNRRREESRELLREGDAELRELAKMDLEEAEAAIPEAEHALKLAMLPSDPLDAKDVIIEIRAGAGGDESSIFSGNLLEMYQRYAALRGWKFEIASVSEGTMGGFKEVTATITGDAVYSGLKWESGVHRVQRVPATEAQGRIHTSTATVAILPEAEDVEVHIDANDLKIDTYRASGAGGQHVNRTDSAVRITHLPTGTVKNRDRAMKILKSRILDAERQKAAAERADARKSQVGTGDRSERIRTYNFPQNRLTDHRIGLTLYKLDRVMMGEVQELIDAMNAAHQAELLQATEKEGIW